MSLSLRRFGMGVLGCAMLAMVSACVASVGYVGDAYEGPVYEGPGYVYGSWDRYHVGPPRGGEHRAEERAHSYRPADRSRSAPSIPHRERHH